MQQFDQTTLKAICGFQKTEATVSVVYARMARHEKHEKHARILNQIATEEREHYETWKSITGLECKPNRIHTTWYTLLFLIVGYTFVLRLMEKSEQQSVVNYCALPTEHPEIQNMIKQEKAHEAMLVSILDEDQLKYVGAIVLGLNDALVELTGSIAGFTFALANTRIIAMAGIITGVSATLSMAASNYLAEKADNNPNAFRASMYTGIAYLVTVVVLITPYLIFPEEMFIQALVTMLAFVILVIMLFNYYVSVAQRQPFFSRFGRMAAISLSVALISFLIGLAAKSILGVDI